MSDSRSEFKQNLKIECCKKPERCDICKDLIKAEDIRVFSEIKHHTSQKETFLSHLSCYVNCPDYAPLPNVHLIPGYKELSDQHKNIAKVQVEAALKKSKAHEDDKLEYNPVQDTNNEIQPMDIDNVTEEPERSDTQEDVEMKSTEDVKTPENDQSDVKKAKVNETSNEVRIEESKKDSKSRVFCDLNGPYHIGLEKRENGEGEKICTLFKMQVIETDNKFFLKSNSASSHEHRNEVFSSAEDACKKFKEIFKEKTGNFWELNAFLELPDKFIPTDGNKKKIELASLQREIGKSWREPRQSSISEGNEGRIVEIDELLNFDKMAHSLRKQLIFQGVDDLLLDLKVVDFKPAVRALDEVRENWKSHQKDKSKEAKKSLEEFRNIIPLKTESKIDKGEEFVQHYEVMKSLINMKRVFHYPLVKELYKSLNTEIKPVEKSSAGYRQIETYVQNTTCPDEGKTLEVKEVFSIKRRGEKLRYHVCRKRDNRMLLWHGSSITNFASILKIGFQRASTSFGSFGLGIYFTDAVSEAVKHCRPEIFGDIVLLALCEVNLGNQEKLEKNSDTVKYKIMPSEDNELPKNKHSIYGEGNIYPDPEKKYIRKDGVVVPYGKLRYKKTAKSKSSRKSQTNIFNDYVIFNEDQINIQHLVRLKVESVKVSDFY